MKFRVERDALAEAVAWAARSLSTRPTMPVLSGLLLSVSGTTLRMSTFDLEASAEVELPVEAADDGTALVSGRLLVDITKSLPARPVEFVLDGARLNLSCGSAKFTLPTMPVDEYPTLPAMPSTAGTVSAAAFATAVAQVALAAGRDDTLPMLTGVRLEIDGTRLTLAATDRYRLAVRELEWTPQTSAAEPTAVLIPARTLADTAKSLAHVGELTIALSSSAAGEGTIGFAGTDVNSGAETAHRATTRLLDATFPPYRSLLPTESASAATITVAPLTEAVKRVSLVADRTTPVRLEFGDSTLVLRAGGEDEGQAEEQLEVAFTGEPLLTAFNPQFLLEGLGAVGTASARMLFTVANKPAVLRPNDSTGGDSAGNGTAGTDYTYLIMPVRLPG